MSMKSYGGLTHIFEKPLQETPTFLESLSPWTQIHSVQTLHLASFADSFGHLHLNNDPVHHHHDPLESVDSFSSFTPSSPSSSTSSNSMFSTDQNPGKNESNYNKKTQHRHSDSLSSMSSESLSMCTEGLGLESCDDVEEDIMSNKDRSTRKENENSHNWAKRSTTMNSLGTFPPPISSIGMSGKPLVCFKSYRENGRFILQEIRIPNQELLHSYRENGRFKLRFIMSDDEVVEKDEEDDDEETNEDTGYPGKGEEETRLGNVEE